MAIALHCVVEFAHAETADRMVAGLPAVARALHEAALAGLGECRVLVGGDWQPSPSVCAEIDRLVGPMRVDFMTVASPSPQPDGEWLHISGERLVPAARIADALARGGAEGVDMVRALRPPPPAFSGTGGEAGMAMLAAAESRIIAATAKPGDGIVSRLINRRVSQAISRSLLKFSWIRPGHATIVTALLGVAMFACLIGMIGQAGLVAGALLFQAASIVDGVDGEIARATFRTSDRGAMLDSLVDAATNLGFVSGVVANLWWQGDHVTAVLGAMGLGLLAAGMALLGWQARRRQGPFTFNAVKDHYRARKSRLMTWLTWLTMRDFYALAGAVLLASGLAAHAVTAFAVVVTGWFVVVIFTLARQAA